MTYPIVTIINQKLFTEKYYTIALSESDHRFASSLLWTGSNNIIKFLGIPTSIFDNVFLFLERPGSMPIKKLSSSQCSEYFILIPYCADCYSFTHSCYHCYCCYIIECLSNCISFVSYIKRECFYRYLYLINIFWLQDTCEGKMAAKRGKDGQTKK